MRDIIVLVVTTEGTKLWQEDPSVWDWTEYEAGEGELLHEFIWNIVFQGQSTYISLSFDIWGLSFVRGLHLCDFNFPFGNS